MSELDQIDRRVTRLEEQMPEVRDLASQASTEASDVHARLRAHTKSLEALRDTQVDQGKEMREGFKEMREGFSKVHVGMAQITALLSNAIKDSDET